LRPGVEGSVSEHESTSDPDGLHERPVREVVENGTALVVRLAGELDLYNADSVRDALLAAVERAPRRLVVDLEAVRFIDSTALGVLIEARSKLPDRRSFVLAAPGLETRRALEVSGLDRHFTVERTVADAIAAEP
jgi:anti-sigma B factor antagonist